MIKKGGTEMRNIFRILLSAGIVLSLAGCQKGTTPGQMNGKAVQFSAKSATFATRTSFSGEGTVTDATKKADEFGRNILKHERIDWVAGDKVLIASDNATLMNDRNTHYATYTVANVEDKGDISEADLEEMAGPDELFFTGADSYTFWGIYPASVGVGTDLLQNKASFTINDAQVMAAATEEPIEVTVDEVTKKLTTLPSDMTQAVMLALAENQTEKSVEMEFYPAFTAFEFTLNSATSDIILKELIIKRALDSETKDRSLAGAVAATIKTNGGSTFVNTPSDKALTITFPENTTITTTDYVTFTVFALPEDIEGLNLEFHLGADGSEIQYANLKQTVNGVKKNINFEKCKKHCLRGIAVPGGWTFKYLTLDIDVLDWVDLESEISSGNGVQATQFSMSFNDGADTDDHCLRYVKGNDKDYRQCWVFNPTFTTGEGAEATTETSVVTVKYKIMMPASTSGTWSIEKCGDTNDFTVEVTSTSGETTTSGNTYSGSLSTGATYLTITIKSTATTLKTLYFKTYVSDGTSTFSLDSETQLYDMRGYHYFIVNGNAATTFDDLNI